MPDLFFADDSGQAAPTRPGMGPLVATGYLHVPSGSVRDLERSLGELCSRNGFPAGPAGEFKWSPGRELWMRSNLVAEARAEFFREALSLARYAECTAVVVIADTSRRTATQAVDHETDVTTLLLERVERQLQSVGRTGIVVVDRPSGGRDDENLFLQSCLETISEGTNYLLPERVAVNVLSTPSSLVRCLQLADVITGCTTALVSGERRYAPITFEHIVPLLRREWGRIGGFGLKIHPDLRYANLYHWSVGDGYLGKGGNGYPLPDDSYPYATDPHEE
jgi:hypothetical protein